LTCALKSTLDDDAFRAYDDGPFELLLDSGLDAVLPLEALPC
jgi:hypothetical protein